MFLRILFLLLLSFRPGKLAAMLFALRFSFHCSEKENGLFVANIEVYRVHSCDRVAMYRNDSDDAASFDFLFQQFCEAMLRLIKVPFHATTHRGTFSKLYSIGNFQKFSFSSFHRSKYSPRVAVAEVEPEAAEEIEEASPEVVSKHLAISDSELRQLEASVNSKTTTELSPSEEVRDLVVDKNIPVGNVPSAVEERLLVAMRKEHELLVEEMKSWDEDPIWKTYEEEANKLMWQINQKCVFILCFH